MVVRGRTGLAYPASTVVVEVGAGSAQATPTQVIVSFSAPGDPANCLNITWPAVPDEQVRGYLVHVDGAFRQWLFRVPNQPGSEAIPQVCEPDGVSFRSRQTIPRPGPLRPQLSPGPSHRNRPRPPTNLTFLGRL